MTKSKLESVAKAIEARVVELHAGRKTWNKQCGQWLVYGFESRIGFSGAAYLCAKVEHAFRKRLSVADAVFECLKELYSDSNQYTDDSVEAVVAQ